MNPKEHLTNSFVMSDLRSETQPALG